MINKVVYINYQPLTERYIKDFYIDYIHEKGLEVFYLDLTGWFLRDTKLAQSVSDMNGFTYVKILKINSKFELVKFLSKLNLVEVFFITNLNYNFRVLNLYRTLTLHNCKLGFFGRGVMPAPSNLYTYRFKRIKDIFFSNRLYFFFLNLIAARLKKLGYIKCFDYIFRAGTEGAKTIGVGCDVDLKYANIVNINYFDYDNWLACKSEADLVKEKYCVFIDQNLTDHPDLEICGLKAPDRIKYFSSLNKFFYEVERKYNLKVVISAHPKALGYFANNPFEGRRIFYNSSCVLVKHSEFVLTHQSTAISYPILFGKPIVFLNSLEIKKAMSDFYYYTEYLSEYLNCCLVLLDEWSDQKDIKFYIDYVKYDEYKFKYLTSCFTEKETSKRLFYNKIIDLL